MRKWTCLLAIALLIAIIPMQVMAAETEPERKGEEEKKSMWELDITGEDLNTRYETLLQDLKDNGFGEKFELQAPKNEGYSMNAVKLFQETYGDLWEGMQLSTPNLPEDLSVGSFLQQGMEMRNSTFSTVRSSELYQNVMGKMDIGSIWAKASEGLPSASSLLTNFFRQDFLSKGNGEKRSNEEYLAGIQEGSLDLFTQSRKKLSDSNKTSFWNAVQDMKDILSSEGSSMDDIFDKMK